MNKPTRLLVVVMYYDGDKSQAEDTACLAADLLEEPNPNVGLLFVRRFDAAAPSLAAVRHVEQKFAFVDSWLCKRRGTGWPMGPNELAFGTFQHLVDRKANLENWDVVLFLESDMVLTRRTWASELIAAWDDARDEGKLVVGTEVHNGYEGYKSHINAGAMYKRDILNELPILVGCSGNVGWDWYFGSTIVPHAKNSALFCLDHQRPTIAQEDIQATDVLVYHGVKDRSAIIGIRNKFLLDKSAVEQMSLQEFCLAKGYELVPAGDNVFTIVVK